MAAHAAIAEGGYAELNPAQRGHLLECQTDKLDKELPKKEADEFMTDYVVEGMAGERAPGAPLQLQMMRKYDISCTHEEIVPKPITAEQVGPFSDDETAALLKCQMRKMSKEMGRKEAEDWFGDAHRAHTGDHHRKREGGQLHRGRDVEDGLTWEEARCQRKA